MPTGTQTPSSTESKRPISRQRRFAYVAIIYSLFLLLLVGVEVGTRLTTSPISSLDLFVVTPQQKAQVADPKQSTIFEGDPLLLWRLKPNLRQAVWDFTIVSTNGSHLRADRELKPKQPGAIRIVCAGDSVTFGFRVPAVWPERPTEYDPSHLPYPMLLEQLLRKANPGRDIEVVTLAVPGYTSHQGLLWLKRDIDQLQPDLLTLSFGWNDASFGDVPDREAISDGSFVVATRWLIDHSQAFARATRWLRSRAQAKESKRRPTPRVSQSEYLNNFREMIQLGRGNGAEVLILGAPYRDNITNRPEAALMNSYRTSLRSAAQETQVPFLEVLELTEAAYPANEGWFGELIHPNHMGHRLITSELLKLLDLNRQLDGLNIPAFAP
ncbi:MAG TPA: SGNH/GDSL hydrolase family protein [Pyrinomonadaceae bacterium]|nr:SGNH/GDSL hydrolase family protein [Pyrinomonadaceae bacterium]